MVSIQKKKKKKVVFAVLLEEQGRVNRYVWDPAPDNLN